MGIVINGKAAAALLKAEGEKAQPSFLNLVKPSVMATQAIQASEVSDDDANSSATTAPMNAESEETATNAALVIRLLDQTNWMPREIPPKIDMVTIGSDPRTSDICVNRGDADANHVALRRIGSLWYVIESARVRTMRMNGAQRPQTALKRGDSCVIALGSRKIIISNPKNPADKPEFINGNNYVVRVHGGPFKHLLDVPLLIGTERSCKIKLKEGPAFAGIVFCLDGRLYLHSINGGDKELAADGAGAAEAPKPLHHLSSITTGGKDICMLEYPDELRDGVSLSSIPNYEGRLMFIETNGPAIGRKFLLPEPGHTFMAGRAPDNMLVVDSLKVSRRHAQIAVYDNSVMITDEGSGNGSYVGGEKIVRRVLHPGERVLFADRAYLLCHSD